MNRKTWLRLKEGYGVSSKTMVDVFGTIPKRKRSAPSIWRRLYLYFIGSGRSKKYLKQQYLTSHPGANGEMDDDNFINAVNDILEEAYWIR